MAHPVVMLPGMMCDARLYAAQMHALASSFTPAFAPISMALDRSDSIEGIAKSILEELPDEFALLGLSMGGIVAMEILRVAPERVTRLAILDSNPLAEVPEKQQASTAADDDDDAHRKSETDRLLYHTAHHGDTVDPRDIALSTDETSE